jgi:hypothetical protein
VKASVAVEDGAYYAAHRIQKASDPNLARGGGQDDSWAQWGSTAGDDVAELSSQGQWQSLIDQNGSARMALSITSGEDILVVIAQAQHFAWYGNGSTLLGGETPSWNTALRIQYALKVDDVLLDNTVTGAFFFPDAPPQQWYRATPSTSADFDYRHIQYVQNTIGTNNAAMPVPLFYAVPVASGTHEVELVGRMLPASDYKTPEDGDGVNVHVFNRQLFVLRIRGGSAYAGDAPNTSVGIFDDGSSFTLGDIFTDGQYNLRDTLNDVEPGNIERGALRAEHLPSLVYGPKTKILTDASPTATIDSNYPGYGVDGAGWTTVAGAAGNLEVTGPDGEWDLSANPGLLVVLVNVQVPYLKWKTGWGGSRVDTRALGILAIATTDAGGARTVHGVSEAYVNSHNRDAYDTTNMHEIDVDIPLMLVIDSDDLSETGDERHIEKVEVLASTWNGADGTTPLVDLKTQRAGLCAFVLKGVHLS